MSRDKLIIAGVIVLGLLGVLVYQQQKRDASLGAPTMASAKDFPSISAPEDIDKLTITNGDKPEVDLERVPDPKGEATDAGPATKWVMTKPIHAAANQQAVKDVVTNLHDLKVESLIPLKLDDEVRKAKQLDAAHGTHVVAYKGADKKVDATFGKSGPAGQLVILADKPEQVWAAKGFSSYLYTKEPKDFRYKEILKFDDANATQVTIANTHGTLSFTKGDKWVATFDKKPLPRFDEEKVKDLLRAYKGMNAEDFGDGKSLADTGLDKPEATVSIQLKDDAGRYEILVGKTATGANHWAKRGDDEMIYQITSYVSEWATAEPSKYQFPADAGADAGKKK